MVFEKIQAILADQLSIDESEITLESRLDDDLGADSLDSIDLVMSIEDEFELEVPEEVIQKIETVADIVNYVEGEI